MGKLNVVLRKEDLDPAFLHDKVVVVIDVLFATSTIVTALHQGATSVQAVANSPMALEAVRGEPEDSYLLAGENHMRSIPGFIGYAPLDVARQSIANRRLVYCTTNGTVALHKAACAAHVYAAALLNGPAMLRQLQQHCESSIVFVCAGSAGRINLEDLFAAGYFIEHLKTTDEDGWQLTDTCSIARAVYRQYAGDPHACLLDSQLGRSLRDPALLEELRYAAQIGTLDILAKLDGDCLKALAP